jgi:hypothetical protein
MVVSVVRRFSVTTFILRREDPSDRQVQGDTTHITHTDDDPRYMVSMCVERIRHVGTAMSHNYLGLYCCCHMKGPLTVTRFVWPAVTLASQASDSTKFVVPTPVQVEVKVREVVRKAHQ